MHQGSQRSDSLYSRYGLSKSVIAAGNQPTCKRHRMVPSTGCRHDHLICQTFNQFWCLQTFGVSMTQLTFIITTWGGCGRDFRHLEEKHQLSLWLGSYWCTSPPFLLLQSLSVETGPSKPKWCSRIRKLTPTHQLSLSGHDETVCSTGTRDDTADLDVIQTAVTMGTPQVLAQVTESS